MVSMQGDTGLRVRVGGGAGVEYKFCFWEDYYFYPVWGANSTKHNN